MGHDIGTTERALFGGGKGREREVKRRAPFGGGEGRHRAMAGRPTFGGGKGHREHSVRNGNALLQGLLQTLSNFYSILTTVDQ